MDVKRETLDELANALQVATLLSARLRLQSGTTTEDAIKLETAVHRAARALRKLQPKKGAKR